VLEDWTLDKTYGNGVTGWVGGWQDYQRQIINGLANLVKYLPFFDANPVLAYHKTQADASLVKSAAA